MVPPHRRAGGGLKPADWASEPAGSTPDPAGRSLEPAGRALEPAGKALEPAGRPLEPAGRPGVSWEGQLRGRGGTETDRQTDRKNRALPVCGGTIGHRPLLGRCPKSVYRKNLRSYIDNVLVSIRVRVMYECICVYKHTSVLGHVYFLCTRP